MRVTRSPCLPPVSGGSESAAGQPRKPAMSSAHCRLQHARIAGRSIVNRIRQGEDGAVVVFDGIVRNHSRGRRTLYLEYEAYEKMALDALEALATEAKTRFEVRDCAIAHRLGRLGDRREQRADCGRLGSSGGGFRCLPLDHRYAEADGAYLEERTFCRWRGVGRWRSISAQRGDLPAQSAERGPKAGWAEATEFKNPANS